MISSRSCRRTAVSEGDNDAMMSSTGSSAAGASSRATASAGVSSGEGDEGKGASLKRFTEPSKETVMSFWSFCTQNKCVISPRCFPLFVEFQKERALQTVVRVFHQPNELSSDRTPTPNRMIASSRKQKRSARRRSEGCDIALMAA